MVYEIFGKLWSAVTSTSKLIFSGGLAALLAGSTALGVQYLKASWPFEEYSEEKWYPTKDLFRRLTKPRRGIGIRWLDGYFRRAIYNSDGKKVGISAVPEDINLPNIRAVGKQNLELEVNAQITYQILTGEDANKFYVQGEGVEEKAREICESAIIRAIKEKSLEEINIDYLTSEVTRTLQKNKILREKYGITVISASVKDIDYTGLTAKIMAQRAREEQEAQASLLRAQSTAMQMQEYVFAAKEALKLAGITEENTTNYNSLVFDEARRLHQADNNEAMVVRGQQSIVMVGGANNAGIMPLSIQPSSSASGGGGSSGNSKGLEEVLSQDSTQMSHIVINENGKAQQVSDKERGEAEKAYREKISTND